MRFLLLWMSPSTAVIAITYAARTVHVDHQQISRPIDVPPLSPRYHHQLSGRLSGCQIPPPFLSRPARILPSLVEIFFAVHIST